MSGLAKLMLDRGNKVYGSDSTKSNLTAELESYGVKIFYGQSKDNIFDGIDLFVRSAAIKSDNEEVKEAVRRNITVCTRAEFLGAIMSLYRLSVAVSGTHGKTTTTTMISDIFLNAKTNPTISVGGIMPSINTNFLIGSDDVFITEACEYTNSFLSFYPDTAIILNCELDHTDFFRDEEDFRKSFKLFTKNINNTGKLIINADIKDYNYFKNEKVDFITFSTTRDADYEARSIQIVENSYIEFDLYYRGILLTKIKLNSIGTYNVSNALAAIACAIENNIDIEIVKSTLENFMATERRFQLMGDIKGVKIISDFAHHPTAVKLAIETARRLNPSKLWVVFQPHAYSRTKEFLQQFSDELAKADAIILTPIYAAREINTYDVDSRDIVELIKSKGKEVYYAENFGEAEDIILTKTQTNDIVMAMGGGDIDKLAKDLMEIDYVK